MDNLENEIVENHYETIDKKLVAVYSLCIFQLISIIFLKNWRENIVRYYSAILSFIIAYNQFTSFVESYYDLFIGFLFLLEGFWLLLGINDLRFSKLITLEIPYIKLRVDLRTPSTIFPLFFSSVLVEISLFFNLEAFDSVLYQSTFLVYILSLYQFVAPPVEEPKTVYCFIHHALFTYIPMFISLWEVCLSLRNFTFFNRLDLAFICLSIVVTQYFRLKPVKENKAKPVVIQNPKEEDFIGPVIQERPRKDEGVQGEPKLSVYIDNEGDLAKLKKID